MTRMNVWVPDDLAARAREARLNVSALTQAAIAAELARTATDAWLATLPAPRGLTHEASMRALDDAREEFGA
ncbi:antitoxin [Allosaccharopolyspora coralli]|uniref:Antitoxin n=1 Tax=Allosaccharopolyspora coralli TaxID=2665642 RepID=A0A5Q3QD76_9PSEU|nr:type II toxin-antitoxin system CcdA family antitoxin [Allosaccharopolyspora coralli]QGK71860.1 antitoxin [Allosaccharopolyspora coralli]